MRRAYQELGWLTMPKEHSNEDTPAETAASEKVYGFSLGFDFCAEHEHGARFIREELGLDSTRVPVGVEGRTMTRVPEGLRFIEYAQRPSDKRFKKTMPAALLVLTHSWGWQKGESQTPLSLAKQFDATFWTEFTDKRYEPGKEDIVCSWGGHSGFAIHVRGQENVERLKHLHQAMAECKVAIADPVIMGFQRKSLSLILIDELPQETLAAVREMDFAHLRLLRAVDDSGIEKLLKAAGKRWYALSPAWESGEGSELVFFLNPCEQHKYAHGWMTLEDLRQWAQEKGPIVEGLAAEAVVKKLDRDFSYNLLVGLNNAGIKTRRHERYAWLDEAKTQVGIRLAVSPDSEHLLPSGTYPLDKLMPYAESGKKSREVPPAEQSQAVA